eukprot:5517565-Amphidinium_carterae.1
MMILKLASMKHVLRCLPLEGSLRVAGSVTGFLLPQQPSMWYPCGCLEAAMSAQESHGWTCSTHAPLLHHVLSMLLTVLCWTLALNSTFARCCLSKRFVARDLCLWKWKMTDTSSTRIGTDAREALWGSGGVLAVLWHSSLDLETLVCRKGRADER